MLRIIVRTVDSGTACHIGGPGTPLDISHKTFDIDAPEIETFLKQWRKPNSCVERSVIGVEILDDTEQQ